MKNLLLILLCLILFSSSCKKDIIKTGCIDPIACNYDVNANTDDESCWYPSIGYDCQGNIIEYVIDMELNGGNVFYIDETGEHGLIYRVHVTNGVMRFIWGCYGDSINGANGLVIGTGMQNSLDIQEGCSESVYAAKEALSIGWHLPSIDELVAIYNSSVFNPSHGFHWYWSSSQATDMKAWAVNFHDGTIEKHAKISELKILLVSSF